METIRQVIQVGSDRKIEITLPDTVQPGLVEVEIVVQPVSKTAGTSEHTNPNQFSLARGFLKRRVDPMEFQQALRREWNE